MANSREEDVRKLASLIQDIKTCMLTTLDSEGCLRSRPMAVQHTPFNGDLWFFTARSTPKTGEVQHDAHVNVTFSDPGKGTFISVSGRAALVHDRAEAKALWDPSYRTWFAKGLEDPDLTLLKVTAEKAEYWDSPGATAVRLLGQQDKATHG